MAFVERDGAHIWWTEDGAGPPLVLLMGLACPHEVWFRLRPALAARHRLILIDNRGCGRTQVRGVPTMHSIHAMADDVAAVLDAAGVHSAHLCGFSMGGMVAQQFALDHPARTLSLVLMATHCGALHSVPPSLAVLSLLMSQGRHADPEAGMRTLRPYEYARGTAPALIDEDYRLRLAHLPTLRGFHAQLYGVAGWGAYFWLPRIKRPTLVLHGLQDAMVPPANGWQLARRIPGAQFIALPDASHWLMTDQTERTLALMTDFLAPAAVPG